MSDQVSDEVSDPMVEEFDTVARWTADAVAELGTDHALPAACRGSGSPAALDWLAAALGLERGTRLVDCGAGVGGPAAYVADRLGVVPTLAEPMVGACRASRRLFGLPVVAADGAALPFADDTFDAAWSMGVLCTVEDKPRHLGEVVRVTRPGAPVGLLVFVRLVDELPHQPEGNHFPTREELDAAVAGVGLRVVDEARVDAFDASPASWQRAVDEVLAVVERDHGEEPGWHAAQEQQAAMVGLIEDGLVAGQLLVCRAP